MNPVNKTHICPHIFLFLFSQQPHGVEDAALLLFSPLSEALQGRGRSPLSFLLFLSLEPPEQGTLLKTTFLAVLRNALLLTKSRSEQVRSAPVARTQGLPAETLKNGNHKPKLATIC